MTPDFFETAAAALPDICREPPPDCGMILGSGWSKALAVDAPLLRLPYSEIPGLGASTVVGHAGESCFSTATDCASRPLWAAVTGMRARVGDRDAR